MMTTISAMMVMMSDHAGGCDDGGYWIIVAGGTFVDDDGGMTWVCPPEQYEKPGGPGGRHLRLPGRGKGIPDDLVGADCRACKVTGRGDVIIS